VLRAMCHGSAGDGVIDGPGSPLFSLGDHSLL
jgi:hypothetical protein